MKRVSLFSAGCLALLLVGAGVFAQSTPAKKAMPAQAAKTAKPATAMFLIESPHTAEECLNVMDETNKAKQLGMWSWGCAAGNHTGYRMVQAADETAALAMVPEDVRAKAHVYKISKMTAEQLEAAHKHM